MNKHLWEIKHSYYCAEGSILEHDSWENFLEDMGDADKDYNFLFRWDWIIDEDEEEPTDKMFLHYMLQRKAVHLTYVVKVKKEEELKIKQFLENKWQYMKNIWEPFSCVEEKGGE